MITKETLNDLLYGYDIDKEQLLPLCDDYTLCSLKIQLSKSQGHPQSLINQLEEERLQIERNMAHMLNPQITHN